MLKSLIMILMLRVIRASELGCPINPVSELLDAVVRYSCLLTGRERSCNKT